MTDVAIANLTDGVSVVATDRIPVSRSPFGTGNDRYLTPGYILSYIQASTPSEITVGTTSIVSGTTTRILYNNAGTLGEYTTSGSGSVVAMATSPILTTPTLGVASATSINGNTFTTGTYTLTGAAGKTLTFSNSLTLAGTDATTMTFPSVSASIPGLAVANTFTTTQTIAPGTAVSPLVLTGGTVTTSQPLIDATQTWNAGAVTFTGLKLSVTNTASAAASLLMDLQFAGSTQFKVGKDGTTTIGDAGLNFVSGGATYKFFWQGGVGATFFEAGAAALSIVSGVALGSGGRVGWASTAAPANTSDLQLTRAAAASLQQGAADAAAPVAQTTQVQSVVAGTSNTAGVNWTIKGSASTGSGTSGDIVLQTAGTGAAATTQNSYSTALSLKGNTQAVLALSPTGGLGYGTGAGGTVTQITSRTTGVTLNKVTGAITLVSASGSATYATFTVTNSAVAATDVVKVCQKSGADKYIILVTAVTAGTFDITFATTGGTTTEQPVFNFTVIKGVTA